LQVREAAVIIQQLAETIDEDDLKSGFLTAATIRAVLEVGGSEGD